MLTLCHDSPLHFTGTSKKLTISLILKDRLLLMIEDTNMVELEVELVDWAAEGTSVGRNYSR